MFLFGKRKKDEPPQEEKEALPSKRKFRDINSQNRKRREPPLKIWGRKERIFVFSIFFITIISSGLLALSSRSWKLPGLPRLDAPLTLLKPTKTILSASPTPSPTARNNIKAKQAVQAFREIANSLTGVYGFYVVRLNDGSSYGDNYDEIYTAASLIKLPVMAATYREAEKERLDIETTYSLQSIDKVSGSGSLYYQPEGTTYTYKELVNLMGKNSDNTAFRAMRRILGEETINQTINSFGMRNTNLENNETTPYDVGMFFYKLTKGKLLERESTEAILDSLTNTAYEAYLPKELPESVRIAHKYGRESHVINDGGVIFAREPFILVIMSKGIKDSEAELNFSKLAKVIYDMETSN